MKGISTRIADVEDNKIEVEISFNAKFKNNVRNEVFNLFREINKKLDKLLTFNEEAGGKE